MIQMIDEWMGRLEQRYPRSDLRALRHRLETLNRDPRFRFMFSKGGSDDNFSRVISRIFRMPADGQPVTIVQVAGLPNEVVNSVVSVLARLAFDVAVWSEGGFEVTLVCEEAHRYISNDPNAGFFPTRQAIGRIAKEGRKYGASLCVVSQRPSELDPTVLSQCCTTFAMRLSNEADQAIVRSAVSDASANVIAALSSIADREAIAFGEAVPTPMRMRFNDFDAKSIAALAASTERRRAESQEWFDLKTLVSRLRGE